MVLLGGKPPLLNVSTNMLPINAMSPYEPLRLSDAVSMRVVPDQDMLPASTAPSLMSRFAFDGVSAVGFVNPDNNSSFFVPVVAAVDAYNRSVGWVMSVVVYAPDTHLPFAGGVWILSGVTSEAFFEDPAPLKSLATLLVHLDGTPLSALEAKARDFMTRARQQAVDALTRTWPAKPGPIGVRGDHLFYSDGSRYFMLGGNYFRGMFSDALSAQSVTVDLANAVQAGLNSIRVYGEIIPRNMKGLARSRFDRKLSSDWFCL